MACIISRPSPEALFQRHRNMFSVNVLGGSPIIPESNEWYVASLNFAMAEEFYSLAEQQWRERDPRYACCENLIELARVEGVFPKGASFAGGFVKITGTAGSLMPKSLQVLIGNKNYISASSYPTHMPEQGFMFVRVQAVEPGADSNSDPQNPVTAGTLTSTTPGIDTTVEVQGGSLCGGAASEDCEAFRQRYLQRKQFPPRADAAWITEKLLEWPCATRVCRRAGSCCTDAGSDCQSCQECAKQLGFYVMFDNSFPCGVAPACVIEELTTWMFGETPGYGLGQAPVGICGRIYPVTASSVDLVITGAGCFSAAHRNTIRDRVTAYFKTLCPSEIVESANILAIIAQVTGTASGVSITLRPQVPTQVSVDDCGNLDPLCDVVPCLASLTFSDEPIGTGCV